MDDVCWNGYRSPAELTDQLSVIPPWDLHDEPLDVDCRGMRFLPNK